MSYKVTAVIVTYNKVDLLKECLSNLISFKELLSKIIVVNNASTDDTEEYLKKLLIKESVLDVQTEAKNLGGAAGFNVGIKKAMENNPDSVWVMDDDTIPTIDTLKKLIEAKDWLEKRKQSWGLLASNVRWIDGNAANMNIPLSFRDWNRSLNPFLVSIEHSSFVSMFINASTIKKVGFPIKEFFIWGDDLEYSNRISALLPCYCVTNSFVTHKMGANQKADIFKDSPDRVSRYFYDVRNNFYICRKRSKKNAFNYAVGVLLKCVRVLFSGKGSFPKFNILIKGFFAGLFFNPKVEKYQDNKR